MHCPGAVLALDPVWAHGVLAYTTVDPVSGGGSLGEIRLVQPALMMHAGTMASRLRVLGMLNFEGLTNS